MKSKKRAAVWAMVVVLTMCAGVAYAAKTDGTTPPPPFMAPPSGICADEYSLYVVADGKIMQYQISDLTLVATLNLPKPSAPEGTPTLLPPADSTSGQVPPPPPGGRSQGVWTSNGILYILAGPIVYRYSIPDLVLQTSVELPKPTPPVTASK